MIIWTQKIGTKDFKFTKDIGRTFLDAYSEIVMRHKDKIWTDEERDYQLRKRGRYVEFNLLYDRGTKFGLMTDGNVEGYLNVDAACCEVGLAPLRN